MVKNKYFAIDAHCHIYPEKIASRAVNGTDTFYDIKSCGKGTVGDLFEVGGKVGIDHFVVQSVATTPKQVRSINDFIAEEVKENNGRLTGLGTLHPDSDDIEGDLEHLISLGLHGVKLHPDIQDFKIDDYRNLKIYELCEKKRIPILIHAGDSRYDRSNPNRLLPILKIYSNLTVIAAHFGGWSIWEEACEKLHGLPNLYVDCSSSFYALTKEKSRELIYKYGADRVLFGTDYPMWSADKEVEYLLQLGLSDDEYKKIFSENAKKVYGIN